VASVTVNAAVIFQAMSVPFLWHAPLMAVRVLVSVPTSMLSTIFPAVADPM